MILPIVLSPSAPLLEPEIFAENQVPAEGFIPGFSALLFLVASLEGEIGEQTESSGKEGESGNANENLSLPGTGILPALAVAIPPDIAQSFDAEEELRGQEHSSLISHSLSLIPLLSGVEPGEEAEAMGGEAKSAPSLDFPRDGELVEPSTLSGIDAEEKGQVDPAKEVDSTKEVDPAKVLDKAPLARPRMESVGSESSVEPPSLGSLQTIIPLAEQEGKGHEGRPEYGDGIITSLSPTDSSVGGKAKEKSEKSSSSPFQGQGDRPSSEGESGTALPERPQLLVPLHKPKIERFPDTPSQRLEVPQPPFFSAGPRPSAVSPEPFSDPWPPMIERVAVEISTHIHQNRHEAFIELEPPELGSLKIELVLEGDQLTARILAETAEARDLIQNHLSELRQALQVHKLELVDARVDVGSWNGERGDLLPGFQHQSEGQQQRGEAFAPPPRTGSVEEEPGRVSALYLGGGSVSVWA